MGSFIGVKPRFDSFGSFIGVKPKLVKGDFRSDESTYSEFVGVVSSAVIKVN